MSLRREVHRAIAMLRKSSTVARQDELVDAVLKAVRVLEAGMAGGSWQDPDFIRRESVTTAGAGTGEAESKGRGEANKQAKRVRWKRGERRGAGEAEADG